MKRIITLLSILLLAITTMAQELESIGQLDSIIHYSYDANTGTLEFESKSEFQYGQNKNPETPNVKVKYSWNSDQRSWIADSGYVYEYDKNGNVISQEVRFYDTNKPAQIAWTLATKVEFKYDENSNKTLKTKYYWDDNISDWIQTQKEEYYYTLDFKDSLSQTFLWGQNQDDWLNYQKSESAYDSFGNKVLVVTYDWIEDVAVWKVKSKNEYTYDENGNTTAQLIYNKNDKIGELELHQSNEYKYDLSVSKVWDPYTEEHQNSLLSINYRDASGTIYATDSLYYSQVESTSFVMETLSEVKIYPNPASDHITIQIENSTQAHYHIYDLFGRQMLSGNLLNNTIDVSGLARGTYLLKIINGHSSYIKRFVKT